MAALTGSRLRWPWRRRVVFLPQMEVAECGAACLAMVLGFHRHHVPLPEMRRACGVARDGANALNLLQAARVYGLAASATQVLDVAALGRLPMPAILHWNFNHFVVLESVGRDHAVIVDPASGRRSLPLTELGRSFTGVALVFAPTPALQPRAEVRPSLARYKALVADHLPSLGQVLLASIALQSIGLAFPLGIKLLLDQVIVPQQQPWLWGLGLGLGAASVAKALMSLVRNWVLQGLQNALDASLMGRFVEHMLHLPLGFFLQREAGELVQRVQSNTILRALFSAQSLSALLDAFLLAGYLALMLAFDWRLGGIVTGFGALRVVQLVALRRRNQRIMAAELAGVGREQGALVAALTGLETTRAIGGEDHMIERWTQHMAVETNRRLERRRLEVDTGQLITVLKGCALAAVFLVGGQAVLEHRITLGVLASFLTLQSLFLVPLESLLAAATQMQFLGTHLRRLDDVLETPVEPTGSVTPGRLRGTIELDDVSFGYTSAAPPLLQGISLAIRPGEKIAIVGRTGAGKSTLARLLMGMHLPTSGVIAFDGRDMRELDLQALRAQMGVVLQESFLFDDTVRANLSLNDPALPLERLQAAARLACIDDVIEAMPAGYASRVGENGGFLSGGQRQRLCLARALAHDPAVLLLDEATSSLDLATEARVHANLAALGCTRIVIAHRLATVRDADRIFVLGDGRLVQQGSYEALVAEGGVFGQWVQSVSTPAPAVTSDA
jgi:ABC-type bacteriocin/lantibiotic exporter with double-glycine peptidase domain